MTKITRVCVFGERVSGTGFVQALFKQNTNLRTVSPYGHKHFYQNIDLLKETDSSDTLFVFITRDLTDWLNSFKNNTFHADKPIRNCTDMTTFLRMEWKCIFDQTSGTSETSTDYGKEMLCERNPEDGSRFENVIRMRNSKMWHFLGIEEIVDNFVHVRYEDVRDQPRLFVEEVCTMFGIPKIKRFQSVHTVRGKGKVPYTRKIYTGLSAADAEFLVGNVDMELERRLGYLEGVD